MPTLEWIGKNAVRNHHREVPYHLIHCDGELSSGAPGDGNLLIEGDNLLALKALLPYYAGRIKCIYIDPPYNTGNEGWIYNDNVNTPEIRKWLHKTVGPEAEDLSRHDKWLCMMYPRLALLRALLASDGVILVSTGKDEIGHLRVMLDEVFGRGCLIEVLIWQIEGNTENQDDITSTHEYIVAYSATPNGAKIRRTVDPNIDDDSKLRRDFAENSVVKNTFKNPPSIIEFPIGFPCEAEQMELAPQQRHAEFMADAKEQGFISRPMRAKFGYDYPIRLDDLVVKGHELQTPCRMFSGWSSARKLRTFIEGEQAPLEDGGTLLTYFISRTGVPTYRRENRQAHFVPTTLRNMGTTEKAANELERMGLNFPYPKPVQLVSYVISLFAGPDDLVLDSFAGSGTTGEAVYRLNAEDNGHRSFILVELDARIARSTTALRLKCVSNGYESVRGKRTIRIRGTQGGFRFCKLEDPLFDNHGQISEGVTFAGLAHHIFFTETGEPLPKRTDSDSPLIGCLNGISYYLLWNGRGDSVLDAPGLKRLRPCSGIKVVYAESCTVSTATLKRKDIIFKQVPYSVKTS